ncbi:tRNA (cytidine(34)-2'-O)-methyltransferase [Thioalkalicoccus limnaeus]|uniref:tRNA (cytidine(34)-2'-O)-methyltransferase n=1 Tax=Thioalkalicoccus limnaeus TaxID=120681 RepID=A0ABV4BHH6_9GAMM
MFDVVLHEPEIPPNTGNLIRLCANVGASLHLIEPLGFAVDDRRLRRAGLDYHEFATMRVHANLEAFWRDRSAARCLACSTRGETPYTEIRFLPGDVLLFGSESRGLPAELLGTVPHGQRLRIPMRPGNRSLNLSNAVAIVLFEAWRQNGFAGAAPIPA